jgi:hypothetical protein
MLMSIAASPIFIGLWMLPGTRSNGLGYMIGVAGLAIWPIGWAFGNLVTKAILQLGVNAQPDWMDSAEVIFMVGGLWLVINVSEGVELLRILTDRGSEFCGNREHHEYELYLDVENIEHTRTKAKSPQTNGICERFHQTIQNEFYASAFRRKVYRSIEVLQLDAEAWIESYNLERTHSGKYCYGKTPMQTFKDSKHLAFEKSIDPSHLGINH